MDYPLIRAWGRQMGSMPYYIEAQVARARQTNAPHDALYERQSSAGRTGQWARLDDLAPDHRLRPMLEDALVASRR
jgi:hypothetical protein